jgi:CheY-like chemotaxis protein
VLTEFRALSKPERRGRLNEMKKILIVDDEQLVRELVEVTLGFGDYSILHAADADEALAIAGAEFPDLILLDVTMPDGSVDGFEVCRQLKSDPSTQGINIVMLTARSEPTDMEKGRQAGADGYFTKPFSPLQLLNKVEDLLG